MKQLPTTAPHTLNEQSSIQHPLTRHHGIPPTPRIPITRRKIQKPHEHTSQTHDSNDMCSIDSPYCNDNDKGDLPSYTRTTGVHSATRNNRPSNIQSQPSKQRTSSSISHNTLPNIDPAQKNTCDTKQLPTPVHNTPNEQSSKQHPLTRYHGNPLTLMHSTKHIRFYGLNIHGISSSHNYAERQHLAEALKLLQIDVWGLQEINLNTGCPNTAYEVASIFKTNDIGTKIQMSTSPELFTTRYKPGGTLTGLDSKLVGRVHSQGADTIGRWSWITLQGAKQRKITIITAYRVCAGNLNSSDGTVWKQEWRALTSPTNASPDPRRQTLIDLKTFTIRRQQKQQSIILFIDANDHLPNSQRFRQDTDLIDIIAHERTDAPSATHMDGNRIDYILLSHDLTAGTIASGILPINHHVI